MQKLKKDSSYSLLTLLFVTIFSPHVPVPCDLVAKITFFSSPSKFCNGKMRNPARNNPSEVDIERGKPHTVPLTFAPDYR